jgi:hypothetical protein
MPPKTRRQTRQSQEANNPTTDNKENESPASAPSARNSSEPLTDSWEPSQSPKPAPEHDKEDVNPVDLRTTTTRKGRSNGWNPWEDRALAIEVLNIRPWSGDHGGQNIVWNLIAENINKAQPEFTRSGSSCQNRLKHVLIPRQKVSILSTQL